MTKEKNYFYDGLYAYNNKDYEKAINCFNEIIDKFSNSIGNATLSETYYMRGICYAQEYSIDEALEDFNEAEKLGFDKSKIYCGRGIAYAHDGKNGEAASNFTKAIELNGSYEEAYCRKGIAYFFDLKFDEAIINFNKAIELNKYYDKAYYYRGVIFCQKREYDKAIKDFDKAIELDNKYILAYNDRGLVYYNKNEYGKAIEDFNKAIELDDKCIIAYNNRGLIYYENKEYDKAIKDFDKIIELNDYYISAYNNRGLVHYDKEEYDMALENFNKAIDLDDEFILAYNNKGLVYLNNNEYDMALENFNKVIELDDKFVLAYKNIGLVYFNINKYDKAFENFKKFDSKIALYYMIELLIKEKKDIDNILDLSKEYEYTDDYFDFITNELEKEEKNKFLKLWIYQYILIDLLFINNYEEIEEFSHYTTKSLFEYFIDYNKKEDDIQSDSIEYLRLTSISKTNDPQEGEILKNLLSINTKKNFNIEETNKDYLVLQTSFIKYTNSLTMFRLYGKKEGKEGTGVCLVFGKSFFNTDNSSIASPSQHLGSSDDKSKENKNNIEKEEFSYKTLQLIYNKSYYNNRGNKLPLYFMLYYDKDKNELIYNPTNSVYENKRIKLNELCNRTFLYSNKIDDNIGIIFKKIFDTIKELKSNEELEIAYKLLINIRYLIKHSSFFEEQELRIIQLVKNDGGNVLFDKDINRLYLNYETPIFERDYLNKVIIGPKVEEAISLKEVYQHLIMKNKSNKNIDIEISDLPLN